MYGKVCTRAFWDRNEHCCLYNMRSQTIGFLNMYAYNNSVPHSFSNNIVKQSSVLVLLLYITETKGTKESGPPRLADMHISRDDDTIGLLLDTMQWQDALFTVFASCTAPKIAFHWS